MIPEQLRQATAWQQGEISLPEDQQIAHVKGLIQGVIEVVGKAPRRELREALKRIESQCLRFQADKFQKRNDEALQRMLNESSGEQ